LWIADCGIIENQRFTHHTFRNSKSTIRNPSTFYRRRAISDCGFRISECVICKVLIINHSVFCHSVGIFCTALCHSVVNGSDAPTSCGITYATNFVNLKNLRDFEQTVFSYIGGIFCTALCHSVGILCRILKILKIITYISNLLKIIYT
jgi:hypothetical protein